MNYLSIKTIKNFINLDNTDMENSHKLSPVQKEKIAFILKVLQWSIVATTFAMFYLGS